MNDIEVSSIDLVEGGNVFKQGHYLTLGYVPRDEKGETVDLSGKTLNVSLWGRKGVVFEAAATYSGGVIRFTFDKLVAAGDYTVEFTATSSTDAKYRKKFPTNQHSGRIAIKQSADDLGVMGIQVYTVAQLKAEQKALLDAAVSGFTVDSETKMARVSGSTTYTSLPARLEADKQATALQLAETVKKGEVSVLDIDKNRGKLDQTFLTDELKQQIAGTAPINAIPAANSITREKIANRSINPNTTTFLKSGKNLVNSELFVSGVVVPSTGEITTSTNNRVIHEFIDIKPSTTYTQKPRLGAIAFYDANKKHISGFNHEAGDEPRVFDTPANAYYIRTSAWNTIIGEYQIEEGGTATPYENYHLKMDNLQVEESGLPMVPNEKIVSVSADKLDVMKPSTNLLNPEAVTQGYYVSPTSGSLSASELMVTSDFIPVLEQVPYTLKVCRYYVFFDENKQRIAGESGLKLKPTLTPPVGAKYIRYTWSVNDSTHTTQQINKGSELLPFEAFGFSIKSNFIKEVDGGSIKNGSIPLSKLHDDAIGVGSKKTLKVLMVGNSYALDVTTYIHKIAESAGINIFVGVLYRDGEALSSHYENAVNNSNNYSFYRRSHIDGVETFDRLTEYSLHDAVLYQDWDVITFQQRSWVSDDYSTYQPFLNDLQTYIKGIATNANVEFGIHQTWSKPNQMNVYTGLVDAYQQAMNAIDSQILIPSGTAVQNARTNTYMLSVGDELTEDGSHLNELGDYIGGLAFFESLLAGRYKKDLFADVKFIPSEVSKYHAYLSKLAVRNAVANPFKVTAF